MTPAPKAPPSKRNPTTPITPYQIHQIHSSTSTDAHSNIRSGHFHFSTKKDIQMYCPKIKEEYIPKFYWLAKSKGTKMMKLVNEIISQHLEQQNEKDLTPAK